MKTFVITLSKTFPRTHIHSGRETNFAHLLGNGLNLTEDGLKICRHKIHTVRTNLPLWEKRISEIQSGQAVLSIREWTGRPYGSPQKELARLTGSDGVGVQALKLKDLFSSTVIDGEKVELPDLAAHDGLSFSDMERQVTVEEVRSFLSASDRQFVKGGIRVSRVRFKRDEEGNCTDILLDYEQTVSETGENNAQEGSK